MINTVALNRMVSIFERKKNARNYLRVMETDRGIIDPIKLYKYKMSDDIFLKKTIVPKQKNHGMIMIVDLSGSMSSLLPHVADHLALLSLFCKRTNIVFESYGFSTAIGKTVDKNLTNGKFALVELLSSGLSKRTIIDRISKIPKMELGGTPLTASIHYTKTLALDFRSKNKIDKLSIIFLTDGDCTQSIWAKYYHDKVSGITIKKSESVPALFELLRKRTGAEVFHINLSERKQSFVKSLNTNGCTAVYDMHVSLLKKNHKLFVDEFIEDIS